MNGQDQNNINLMV